MKNTNANKFLCGVIVVLLLLTVFPAAGSQEKEAQTTAQQEEKEAQAEKKQEKPEAAEAAKETPETGKVAGQKPKKRSGISFDFEKAGLEKTAAEQMRYFLQVPPLIKKINRAAKRGRTANAPKKKIASLLEKAAAIAKDEAQKEYIKSLSAGIEKEDFSESESKWLAQADQRIDIIITHKKGKKRRLAVYILFYPVEIDEAKAAAAGSPSKEAVKKDSSKPGDAPQKTVFNPNSRIKKYISRLDKLLDNIPINEKLAPVNSAAVNPIVAADVVFAPTADRYALIFPGVSSADAPGKFKTLIFRNRLEAYFKKSVLPLAEKALTPRWTRVVDFDSYLSNQMMHRLAHYLGPVLVESGDSVETVQSKLKDVFFLIEELRADTAAIAGTSVLLEEKLITPQQEIGIYSTHLVTLLSLLRTDPGKDITASAVLQLNQLFKTGGIVFDINSRKLEIEPKLFGAALRRLMLTAAQAELSGDYDGAKLYVEGKGVSAANELSEVLKSLDRKERPVRKSRKARKKGAAHPPSKETAAEKATRFWE